MPDLVQVYRGSEASIDKFGISNGGIYFSTDTDKIFFDADGERHTMSSGGSINFAYGEVKNPVQDADTMLYALPLTDIDAKVVSVGDIIINSDNGFYKVNNIEDGMANCDLMAISGSGGGGTGSGRRLAIQKITSFPLNVASGYPAVGQIKVTSNFSEDTEVDLVVTAKASGRLENIVRVYKVPVGEVYDVTIPAVDLLSGGNTIEMVARESEDYSGKNVQSINVISIGFSASSSWNPMEKFSIKKPVDFGYRLDGLPTDSSIPATIDYYVDDLLIMEQANVKTESSFCNLTDKFEDMGHGDHQLRITATVLINNENVKIGELNYNIMWIVDGEQAPIIISPYVNTEEVNYSIINIPYMVYDPNADEDTAEVHYYINDEEISTGAKFVSYSSSTYDVWEVNSYIPEEVNAFAITCGITTKTFEVKVVRDSTRNLDPISEKCHLYLSSFGRSNNESTLQRETWTYTNGSNETTTVAFNGFNWYNNGWIKDEDNHVALRLSNGANISIPLKVLGSKEGQNLTFEVDFKMRNVTGYEKLVNIEMVDDPQGTIDPETNKVKKIPKKTASNERNVVGQYYGNSIGLCIGTQETYFASQNNLVNVSYPDEQRVKVSVVLNTVEKLIYIYINSILTGIQKFSEDSFAAGAEYFTFNSKYCDIDIYTIRVYTSALNYMQIIQNWYGDAPDLNAKLERYDRNNISKYDAKGQATIDYMMAMESGLIPIMTISTVGQDITNDTTSDSLPYQKGLKKTVKVRYYDPFEPEKNFHCQNVSLDVQGTSSQGYPRRNYKLKLKIADETIKEKFPFHLQKWEPAEDAEEPIKSLEIRKDIYDGKEFKKYNLGYGGEETSFCLKADYMESSSSHNTGLANYIDRLSSKLSDTYDLRHPLIKEGFTGNYRTTVYGYPILLFHENAKGEMTFVGKYNFNIDKSATDSFGFSCGEVQPFMSKTVETPYTQKFAFRVDELSADKTSEGFYPQLKAIAEMADILTAYTEQTDYCTAKKVVKPIKFKSNNDLMKLPAAVNNVEGLYTFTYNGAGWDIAHVTDATIPTSASISGGEVVATNVSKETLETTYGIQFEDYVTANLVANIQFWFYVTPTITLTVIEGSSVTFEEAAECWEFKNNQSGGRATFQEINFEETDKEGKLALLSDFENRYHYADFDTDDMYEAAKGDFAKANAEILGYMGNFKKLCEWVNSTDTSRDLTKNPITDLLTPVYFKTLDTEWAKDTTYYEETADGYVPFTVTESIAIIPNKSGVTVDSDIFVAKIKDYYGINDNAFLVGDYTFSPKNGEWLFNSIVINLSDFGISFSGTAPTEDVEISIVVTNTWNSNLYEYFTRDTDRYRLCKFKAEFDQHLNKPYCLFYAIMTEFLLMYDSRAKNMMLASWGPEAQDGEYIWYPIFYDMDTQLGINNSGIVYWDYDTNATPDDGSASIFSGAASVLWNNISTCFTNEMKTLYRLLRKNALNYTELINYYDTKQTDKWSEIMKNIDAFYKYIAPSLPSIGYTNIDGKIATTDTFFYCLQGDRQLNRDLFFRNRLNYMDSKWQGGNYQIGAQGGSSIQMRYNANDKANTSDPGTPSDLSLDANATYTITPYLSQYCMLFYDERVTEPKRFDAEADESVTIEPPISLKNKIEGHSPFTQQLVYLYGPEYIADLGDLSLKYLNEFFGQYAVKLQHLKVGNENPGYQNSGLNDDNFKLDSAAYIPDAGGTTVANPNAKTLLSTLDVSNLSALTQGLDLSGCTKLKVLKALGTNLPDVTLPDGNILETVYLPSTITSIRLIEPQALTAIIEDPSHANYLQNDKGLFIQGLTDQLETETDADAVTKINSYAIENTLLKYDTYRILKKLYDIKVKMQENNKLDIAYSPVLRLSLRGVDWTPYHRLEDDAKYDLNKADKYYLRNSNMTYERYYYQENTWSNTLKNNGVYLRDDEDSIVTNLDMIDTFLTQYQDTSIDVNHQYFRSTFEDANGVRKYVVPVTGNIHINNDADHPLDEARLLNYYNASYPELTITANYVTDAWRAQFIEVDENNRQITKGWQKAEKGLSEKPVVAYSGTLPSRIHYDFLGWSTNSALLENQSIGTLEDVVDLTKLTLDKNYTFYAVYSIHSYPVYLKYTDGRDIATVLVPSGSTIKLPDIIPYQNDDSLEETQCYKFIGYGNNDGSSSIIDLESMKIYKAGATFYAKFIVASIYDNPLDNRYLVVSPAGVSGGMQVGLKKGVRVQGKICFPATATTSNGVTGPVIAILENTTMGGSDSVGWYADTLETVTGKAPGYDAGDTNRIVIGSNGIAGCETITGIYFKGVEDNTCKITTFNTGAFYNMRNLAHIDLPNSLTSISDYALAYCRHLNLSTTNNITVFGQGSMALVNLFGNASSLQISGDVRNIMGQAFNQAGWASITIGSPNSPCDNLIGNLQGNNPTFGGVPYTEMYSTLSGRELKSFVIYSNVIKSGIDQMFNDPMPEISYLS